MIYDMSISYTAGGDDTGSSRWSIKCLRVLVNDVQVSLFPFSLGGSVIFFYVNYLLLCGLSSFFDLLIIGSPRMALWSTLNRAKVHRVEVFLQLCKLSVLIMLDPDYVVSAFLFNIQAGD